MAYNWGHEYPTGTPIEYIRDDIIEMWERADKVGIFQNIDAEQKIPVEKSVDRMDIIGQNGNDGLHYDVEPDVEPREENDPRPFDNDSLPTNKGGVKIR